MTTVYEAVETIVTDSIETLEFSLKNDQISSVFDLNEFINERIDYYCEHSLIITHDINTLWIDLNSPEPSEMQDTISNSIMYAIRETLREVDSVYYQTHTKITAWAENVAELLYIDTEGMAGEEIIQNLA